MLLKGCIVSFPPIDKPNEQQHQGWHYSLLRIVQLQINNLFPYKKAINAIRIDISLTKHEARILLEFLFNRKIDDYVISHILDLILDGQKFIMIQ